MEGSGDQSMRFNELSPVEVAVLREPHELNYHGLHHHEPSHHRHGHDHHHHRGHHRHHHHHHHEGGHHHHHHREGRHVGLVLDGADFDRRMPIPEPIVRFPFEEMVWSRADRHRHPYGDRRTGLSQRRRDGRKLHKVLKRRHRRHHHHHGHMKRDRLCRAYLRHCGSADQLGHAAVEVPGAEGRDGFPSHLLRDGLDEDERDERLKRSQFADFFFGGLIEATMTPSQQVALAVAESLAAMRDDGASQLHPRLVSSSGYRERHRSHHRHRRHDNCDLRRAEAHQPSAGESVDVVPEVQAPVPITRVVDEAGPSATYEEKLAEGLIPFPEAREDSA